jgi:predicted RNA-binding protein YlqC (UPF0109 family)
MCIVQTIVKELVTYPEEVVIKRVPNDGSTTLEIHVNPKDIGKVIGKEGRVANAIRVIAKAAAMKNREKAYIEIVIPANAEGLPEISEKDIASAQELVAA